MEKSVEKTVANKSKIAVWDCGSTLYDSFELNSFKRQLDSALVRRSLSMPHSTNHRATPPPPPSQPQLNIVAAKKPSEKIYRSLSKLIRSVFRTRPNNSGSIFRLLQDGSNTDGPFYVVYDTSGALTTIPEAPEIDLGGLSPEIGSLVRRTSSERFSATSLGIQCKALNR